MVAERGGSSTGGTIQPGAWPAAALAIAGMPDEALTIMRIAVTW